MNKKLIICFLESNKIKFNFLNTNINMNKKNENFVKFLLEVHKRIEKNYISISLIELEKVFKVFISESDKKKFNLKSQYNYKDFLIDISDEIQEILQEKINIEEILIIIQDDENLITFLRFLDRQINLNENSSKNIFVNNKFFIFLSEFFNNLCNNYSNDMKNKEAFYDFIGILKRIVKNLFFIEKFENLEDFLKILPFFINFQLFNFLKDEFAEVFDKILSENILKKNLTKVVNYLMNFSVDKNFNTIFIVNLFDFLFKCKNDFYLDYKENIQKVKKN